jgi:hypothetical protein
VNQITEAAGINSSTQDGIGLLLIGQGTAFNKKPEFFFFFLESHHRNAAERRAPSLLTPCSEPDECVFPAKQGSSSDQNSTSFFPGFQMRLHITHLQIMTCDEQSP